MSLITTREFPPDIDQGGAEMAEEGTYSFNENVRMVPPSGVESSFSERIKTSVMNIKIPKLDQKEMSPIKTEILSESSINPIDLIDRNSRLKKFARSPILKNRIKLN
jgi:hypothetical protein